MFRSVRTAGLILAFLSASPIGDGIVLAGERNAPGGSAASMTPAENPRATAGISFADVLERALPAVVTVRVTGEVQVPIEFKPGAPLPSVASIEKRAVRSGGSGVVVDPSKGHVLTNNHVIDGAVKIEVVLRDGRLLPARLVGRDIGTDLAVIELPVSDIQGLPVGNSDQVRIGDVVLAIGNPFGLESTATMGIVSATMRSEIGHEAFEDFFQIDAVINPGNSGGALVNTRGELIAINTATAGRSGNVGIGFAIPINMAKTVKTELIRHGHMRRGSVGILAEDLSLEQATALMSRTNRGALVTSIVPGSPADNAGVSPGDVVTEIDGKPVRSATELATRVVTVPLGSSIRVRLRKDGTDRELLMATAMIAEPQPQVSVPADLGGLEGLVLADIGAGNPLFGDIRGAQVISVAAGSRAARAGLLAGDVIIGIDDVDTRSTERVLRQLERTGMAYRLRLIRAGVTGWSRVAH
jgi:S1-C subfamily serine protease